jgi:hypothetical protein
MHEKQKSKIFTKIVDFSSKIRENLVIFTKIWRYIAFVGGYIHVCLYSSCIGLYTCEEKRKFFTKIVDFSPKISENQVFLQDFRRLYRCEENKFLHKNCDFSHKIRENYVIFTQNRRLTGLYKPV